MQKLVGWMTFIMFTSVINSACTSLSRTDGVNAQDATWPVPQLHLGTAWKDLFYRSQLVLPVSEMTWFVIGNLIHWHKFGLYQVYLTVIIKDCLLWVCYVSRYRQLTGGLFGNSSKISKLKEDLWCSFSGAYLYFGFLLEHFYML